MPTFERTSIVCGEVFRGDRLSAERATNPLVRELQLTALSTHHPRAALFAARGRNRLGWRSLLLAAICGLATSWLPATASAQGPPLIGSATETRLQDVSFVYIPPPPLPEEIKVNDVIVIEVDEKGESNITSRFQRQRTGAFNAALTSFLKIGDNLTLENTALNAPTISGSLTNRLQTIGTAVDNEGTTFRIAAFVTDVKPNGLLVLEARKEVQTGQNLFTYRLTGTVNSKDIKPDRTIRSEKIADSRIIRSSSGKVYDSTKTGWGTRLLDRIFPF